MRKKFHWDWLAWLALLLWIGEYSQRMGAEPMIGNLIWFSPAVKEVVFTILYFFSTISAFLISIGFVVYVVWQAISFVRERKTRKP